MMKLSCKRCHIRKLKCSRSLPCTNCASATETCVSRNQDKRKKPVSHDYVDALERQVAQLESAIARIKPTLSAEAIESLGLPDAQDHLELPSAPTEAEEKNSSSPESPTQFRRTADGHLLYHGRTSIYRVRPEQGGHETYLPEIRIASSPNSDHTDCSLQQDPTVHTSIRLFFRWQYPSFMFVYREAFLLDYLGDTFDGRFCSPALIYAVCALGAIMSEDPAVSSMAPVFQEKAHDALFPDGFASPHITTIQALLCLAFAELGEGAVSRAWLFSGMAFRLCQNAGLQQEMRGIRPTSASSDVRLDLEIRRRMYWGCYLADSVMSLLLGRPVFFDHESASVCLSEPLPDMPFLIDWIETDSAPTAPESKVPYVRYLRAVSELSRITHNLVSRICSTEGDTERRRLKIPALQQLDTKLCQWLDQLPEDLRWNRWYPTNRTLYPHVASLYIMALSVRLCLYDEYTTMAPNNSFAQTSRSTRDSLIDEICRLVLHFKTQHGLRFAPLMVVYSLAVCLHVIEKTREQRSGGDGEGGGSGSSSKSGKASTEDSLRRGVLAGYLRECSGVYKIAAEMETQIPQANAGSHQPGASHLAQTQAAENSFVTYDFGGEPLFPLDAMVPPDTQHDPTMNMNTNAITNDSQTNLNYPTNGAQSIPASNLALPMPTQYLDPTLDPMWQAYPRFNFCDFQAEGDGQGQGHSGQSGELDMAALDFSLLPGFGEGMGRWDGGGGGFAGG